MPEMVEVVIDSIRANLMNPQRIVILREIGRERYLPIWVGVYEAEHLTIALQDVETARPLTYDLFIRILKSLAARILQVEVVALRNETFYGNIVIEINGEILNVDSRPSDAINLAARVGAPILVARDVMEIAGIVPEEDEIQEGDYAEEESASEGGEERLSVFEDFLEQLIDDDEEEKKK
jgi:bifunctional DNase/RNase